MRNQLRIRSDGRGQAGFALVAVALLMAGAAAALYLQAASMTTAQGEARQVADLSALEMAAQSETDVLGALAVIVLEDSVPGEAGRDPTVASASIGVDVGLRDLLNRTYPRVNALGHRVEVALRFARVLPVTAGAEVTSPGGARTLLEFPVYLGVEAAADLHISGLDGSDLRRLVGFGGSGRAPSLLPFALASRVGLEASHGGRVERFVGQAAEAFLNSDGEQNFTTATAREIVRLGLQLEIANQFSSSGNASLDRFLAAKLAGGAPWTAPEFFQDSRGAFYESFAPPPVGRGVGLEGAIASARITILNLTDDGLGVYPAWSLFDGQELGGGTWGALTIEVWGSVSFGMRVEFDGGSFEVAAIEVPVAFNTRSMKADLAPEVFVPRPSVDAAFRALNQTLGGSLYQARLMAAGVPPGANGSYPDNATVRAALLDILAGEQRVAMPPVEDAVRFQVAYEAPRGRHVDVALRLAGVTEGPARRATLTIDGVRWASSVIESGGVRFTAVRTGIHNVSVEVITEANRFSGGGRFDLGEANWSGDLQLEPVADLGFLRDALAWSAGRPNATAGTYLLAAAASLAGIDGPPGVGTSEEARETTGRVLIQLEALINSNLFSLAKLIRAKQAAGVLKIFTALLDAADAARRQSTGSNQSLGALTASVSILAFTGNPAGLIYVTAAASKIALVSIEEGGLLVRFFKSERAVQQLAFRLSEFALVAQALGGALSLASDFVAIKREADDGDRVGWSIQVAKTQFHLVDLTLAMAKGVYSLAGAATPALKVAFKSTGLAVGAAALLLEVALLYHDHNGNLGAVGQALIHPADLAGIISLPGMVGSAIATFGGLLGLAAGSSVEFGPIGLAAGLFVLAALLVINAREVAPAFFGTLPASAAHNISAQFTPAARALFEAAAAGNAVDTAALFCAERASAGRAWDAWLAERIAPDDRAHLVAHLAYGQWNGRSRAFALLGAAALQLRHASLAAVEELDDFASGAFVADTGRWTEGYAFVRGALGQEYQFEGHVEVNSTVGGVVVPLLRLEWRRLLAARSVAELGGYSIGYRLTETNSIPSGQFTVWADKFGASANQVRASIGRVEEAQRLLSSSPGP